MKKIWAPWRIDYIKQTRDDDECFICEIINDDPINDKKNLILYRGKKVIVLLNLYPYIAGHLMIAPIEHTAELKDLPLETGSDMWELTTKTVELLKAAIQPEGFNIGLNLGKVSGAGLKTHLHIHIVPRWSGDTNFMPILSDTRVISQELAETYSELEKFKEILEK
ncbi:MAG: HIT domain-containing protein [Candidatus Heimdallarchaeota archaeon]|nr:HIT domain-containing protein [Candidatus Heimdallarchaeota archaeon]MCK5159643.1 HIT domain-containing protein [Candidatus Heimdallarchaeota archaeon]MCK5184030.1 HIT domain-containing protein [Candidatus Heimdallarchaeota archaeon]MCK5297721.1 HIT domain-containing protein [Candidatus Heimdallarchaeota archaeon]